MTWLVVKRAQIIGKFKEKWSGLRDSNPRPPAPKAGALPACAKPRTVWVVYRLKSLVILEPRNPWTFDFLGQMPSADPETVEKAVENAWFRFENPIPIEERVGLLTTVADSIQTSAKDLAEYLSLETGKPIRYAVAEVERAERTFRLAAGAKHLLEAKNLDVSFDPRGRDFDVSFKRFPVGLILGFVPYNWPLNLAAHKIAPAILCGNPIIIKLSPLAPFSTWKLIKLILDAGALSGMVTGLHLENEMAQKLLQDSRIQMLSFTGSPKIGWMLKEKVLIKRVSLELGGNTPVIVTSDANTLDAAKKTALSGYAYAGQVCISAQNVFAHADIFNDFRDNLINETESTICGDPKSNETVVGPMINSAAADRVRNLITQTPIAVADAIDHPCLVPATLIENPPTGSQIRDTEAFGPILNLIPYKDQNQLLNELNGGKYRLHASVFSATEGDWWAENLRFGGVVINDSPSIRFDNMPYGGEGESGYGREGIEFAVQEMSYLKSRLGRHS